MLALSSPINTVASYTVSLPPEIWIHIHRLATCDMSPMVPAYTDRFQYKLTPEPLKEMQGFLLNACSFSLVCRLWNSLAKDLLYENIRVDDRFHGLYAALKTSNSAPLVHSVRLSPTRIDHNYAILALCPRVRIIVQPDASGDEVLLSDISSDKPEPRLPELCSLEHIYWTQSNIASGFLCKIIPVAPHLKYLFLTQSTILEAGDAPDLSALHGLQRLGLGAVGLNFGTFVFQADLQTLTRLTCASSHVELLDFHSLPSLRTLELIGSRSNIPFRTIFKCCPRLYELSYDVWNNFSGPHSEPSPLSCIRLHSAVAAIRSRSAIANHFSLLLSPGFPILQRIVLRGSWHRVVGSSPFLRFRDGLKVLGCQLEFPEGHVC